MTHPNQTLLPSASSRLCVKTFPLLFSLLLTFPTLADEAALLGQLATGTPAERDAARQSLLVTATPAAIPQLAIQLASPETFDNACFLLEAMRLPEADATLRATSPRQPGANRPGFSTP